MCRLLSVTGLVLVLAGCSASPGTVPTDGANSGSIAPSTPAGSSTPAMTAAPSFPASAAPSGGTGNSGALPAACAEGFAKYLADIEPVVSAFDPATATLGDVSTADQAVNEKSIELLMANDSRAPYSCSEVGLEWAYFDSNTPWDAVLALAASTAPGTVGYLTAVRDMAAMSAEVDNRIAGYLAVRGARRSEETQS